MTVLVISSSDESREAAYVVVSGLKDNGHDGLICCSPEAETRIKPDLRLDEETSLGGVSGVVVLDDGGDAEACAKIVSRANKDDLVVGGIGPGCLIMASCGILKDHYVCDGLPEEAYKGKGVEKVESPSVRSDTVLTCSDVRMADGFLSLVIDALGGKARRVVTGDDAPVTEASLLIVDDTSAWPDYWGVARELDKKGCRTFIGRWEDVDVASGRAGCLSMGPDGVKTCMTVGIPKTIWFRQQMPLRDAACAVSELESLGCRNVNSSESIRLASEPLDELLGGVVEVGKPDEQGFKVIANRGEDGWKAEALGDVREAVESACTAFQSSLDDHDGANSVSVRVTLRDDRPTINGIDPLDSDMAIDARGDDPVTLRAIVEREMAHEGMWLQPDGRLAILEDGHFKRLPPEEALLDLRKKVLSAIRREIEESHRGKEDVAMKRARRLSRRARHRFFLAFELLGANVTTAYGLYPSGVAGPWAHLDIPMFERVFQWQEGDDWLKDREKAISKLPRYNPQYDLHGFYFKWIEPRNLAYAWENRFNEGSYPMRNVLNLNR